MTATVGTIVAGPVPHTTAAGGPIPGPQTKTIIGGGLTPVPQTMTGGLTAEQSTASVSTVD